MDDLKPDPDVQQHITLLDWFAQLNPFVQAAMIAGVVALLTLIIINPAAGVGVTTLTGFLLALKTIFGRDDGTLQSFRVTSKLTRTVEHCPTAPSVNTGGKDDSPTRQSTEP